MATIQDLLQLDLAKIQPKALQDSVKEIIADYKSIEAKTVFEAEEAASIDKIYKMVTNISPNAIIENPCLDVKEEKLKKKTPKKAKETASKKKKKITENVKKEPQKKTVTKEDIDALLEEIEHCRKIRQYNAQRRKEQGKKPKPSPYMKIKAHFISLGNLIPKRLKEDLNTQKEANKLLRNTHRSLLKIYKMNAIKGRKDNDELKERFEKIEEKLDN